MQMDPAYCWDTLAYRGLQRRLTSTLPEGRRQPQQRNPCGCRNACNATAYDINIKSLRLAARSNDDGAGAAGRGGFPRWHPPLVIFMLVLRLHKLIVWRA